MSCGIVFHISKNCRVGSSLSVLLGWGMGFRLVPRCVALWSVALCPLSLLVVCLAHFTSTLSLGLTRLTFFDCTYILVTDGLMPQGAHVTKTKKLQIGQLKLCQNSPQNMRVAGAAPCGADVITKLEAVPSRGKLRVRQGFGSGKVSGSGARSWASAASTAASTAASAPGAPIQP